MGCVQGSIAVIVDVIVGIALDVFVNLYCMPSLVVVADYYLYGF